MRGPDEGPAPFVNDIAHRAALRIHFDNAKALVSAIGHLIGKVAAILAPMQARLQPFVLKFIDLRFDLLARGHIEHGQFIGREFVARKSIGTGLKLCASAAGGG